MYSTNTVMMIVNTFIVFEFMTNKLIASQVVIPGFVVIIKSNNITLIKI